MGIFKKKHSFAADIAKHAKDAMDLRTLTDATAAFLQNPEKYGLSEKATENGQPSKITASKSCWVYTRKECFLHDF